MVCSPNDLKIEHIAGPYTVAEGSHWDEERNLLYYVDIPGQNIFCYNPATQMITHTYLNCGPVGYAIPLSGRNNTFIAGCKTSIIIVHWDPRTNNLNPEYHVISQVDQDISDTRFNDAKVDPRGRLWAGTMGEKNGVPLTDKGSMYRVDHDGTVAKIIDHVDISNGLVWNHFNDSFYFIDSFAYKIDEYSYDINSGDIANKRARCST
ncbi:regucalcin-like [Cotesia glomerata]|uniref:regucalcin-like n=1 Tax=Cotesia glomerata TaxID=32391 RepID=UPI001D00465B|nr:regucalcin-like [Cotesia glomerata]